MKSLRLMGLALVALALIVPFSAQAAVEKGWYVGSQLDWSFQDESDSTVSSVTNEIDYNTGWGLSGEVGYGWGNGLRVAGELVYRNATVDGVSGTNSGAAGGGIHNKAIMANVYYDIETGTRFTPYVGAGVGGSYVDADNLRTINGTTLDDSSFELAYQGIVGTAVDLDGPWDFTLDYRYFATPDVKFKTSAATTAETTNSSHNLMVGLRYVFAEPEDVAPAPMAALVPPAPKPVVMPKVKAPYVAPVPQSYIVFFDFDKSYLTPEAKRIVAAAAKDYQSGSYVRLVVTGHTDTMGTSLYNQRLSERRAATVKAEFSRLGVEAAKVAATGSGKRALMVPTADGVREAQNRRAEIIFQR